MRIHRDWSTDAFDLPPSAVRLGPFVRREFLETWWRHRGSGELLLVESADALLPLYRDGSTVAFLGEGDLTDYHAPLGTDAAETIRRFALEMDAGVEFVLDSLPAEAADRVETGLAGAGLAATRTEHEVAAVLDLPATRRDYLDGLSRKQRHEVRRKRRRFAEALGEPSLVREANRFGDFVAMHRSAPGDKGEFMTPEMEKFFADLLQIPGAALDVLLSGDGTALAAGFGFEDEDGYYLYNSAFSSEAAHASPGVVLIDLLIEREIGEGRRRFDFLKGDEVYKFRLGARRRPLYRVEAVR